MSVNRYFLQAACGVCRDYHLDKSKDKEPGDGLLEVAMLRS